MKKNIVILGGGAAGFFCALRCKSLNPSQNVTIIEKNNIVLSKVRISGGGRCNVTHACFDPKELIQRYPRGSKELLAPFYTFQPKDTIEWFEKRGVVIKKEGDGRMFPVTDSSETIIACFLKEIDRLGINVVKKTQVTDIEKKKHTFELTLSNAQRMEADFLVIATGSSRSIYTILERIGHTIAPPVPSLFTFNIPDLPFFHLQGTSVSDVGVTIEGTKYVQRGPLLITHWGFSGPSVLKLSSWAARYLHEKEYRVNIRINWLPGYTKEEIIKVLQDLRRDFPQKQITTTSPFSLSQKLWKEHCLRAGIEGEKLSHITKKQIEKLIDILTQDAFMLNGKTTYVDEFVTAGGVVLKEVDFKTMESKIIPKLFFAGEVLDIDGITGGFNFQNAWTTAWIAASGIERYNQKF